VSGSVKSKIPGHLKKLGQTHEHRLLELQLAISGEIRGIHRISSSCCKFQVNLEAFAHPQFVEVLSEQEIVMLYVNLEDANISEPSPQYEEVFLSDDRRLDFEVAISGGRLVITVSYYDPLLDQPHETILEEAAGYVLHYSPELPPDIEHPRTTCELWKRFVTWVPKLRNPYGIGLGIMAGVAVLFNFLLIIPGRERDKAAPLDPNLLLARSQTAGQLSTPERSAMHRTFSVEVRSRTGAVIESGKIDSLRSTTPSRSALKLLSPEGRLLAGN